MASVSSSARSIDASSTYEINNDMSAPFVDAGTSMRRLWTTDLLLVLLGVSSWAAVNGVWVELPLLVRQLPEGWTLPSYLSVIVQLANLGPLTYALLRWHVFRSRRLDTLVVFLMLTVAALACLLAGLLWQRTAELGGRQHSVALLVLTFFIALVDCTSSVVYVPFTARFHSRYLVSYMAGEGLSGLLPSVVALAQGAGGNPRCVNSTQLVDGVNVTRLVPEAAEPLFSVSAFFYFLFVMMVVSGLAFVCLLYLPSLDPSRDKRTSLSTSTSELQQFSANAATARPDGQQLPRPRLLQLLVLHALLCLFSNGLLPGLQTYSVLPYGNVAFHLVASLSLMANPAACGLLLLLPCRRLRSLLAFSALSVLVACYIIFTAARSPTPPLQHSPLGQTLVVVSWILFVGVVTYAKVGIAGALRPHGIRPLFWYGVATQIGSLVGSIVTFVVVNGLGVFTGYYPC